MKIGYARVSTHEQDAQLQIDALNAAGCERIYEEKQSGAQQDRHELQRCLKSLQGRGYINRMETGSPGLQFAIFN